MERTILRLRPQILIAILCGTGFALFAIWIGWQMEATEIVTAVVGSLFGFIAGVSLKVLESE